MEGLFKKVSVNTLSENFFSKLHQEWALLTAGKADDFNCMTISWGTFGVIWNRPVFFCFVRPQRHTNEFMKKSHYFTLTFFDSSYKQALDYCGSHSGRDANKLKNTDLVPYTTDLGNVIYEQAQVAFECKKIYTDLIKPEAFIDPSIIKTTYPQNDFHHMYFGEIVNCFKPR
jgi:flavin reductase (DIM6/NTAB) family NADH-FMN oxidoreductase RutF